MSVFAGDQDDEFDLDIRIGAPRAERRPGDPLPTRVSCICPTERGNTCEGTCMRDTCQTCHTNCGTCGTCETQCDQYTCYTKIETQCGTCQTACGTCNTLCGQDTCHTCRTQCDQATCDCQTRIACTHVTCGNARTCERC